jgi:hypothetical protein
MQKSFSDLEYAAKKKLIRRDRCKRDGSTVVDIGTAIVQ